MPIYYVHVLSCHSQNLCDPQSHVQKLSVTYLITPGKTGENTGILHNTS